MGTLIHIHISLLILQNNSSAIEEDLALMKQRKFQQKKNDISVAQSETTIIKKVC